MTSMRTMVSRDCIFTLVVFRIDPHRVFTSTPSMTSMRTMVSRDCIFTLYLYQDPFIREVAVKLHPYSSSLYQGGGL